VTLFKIPLLLAAQSGAEGKGREIKLVLEKNRCIEVAV